MTSIKDRKALVVKWYTYVKVPKMCYRSYELCKGGKMNVKLHIYYAWQECILFNSNIILI